MLRHTIVLCLGLLFLSCSAFGEVWYSEDFNGFKDGDIVGQDGWQAAMNQQTCEIQDDVKHGDEGKSILITQNTMAIRNFEDTHDKTQYGALAI